MPRLRRRYATEVTSQPDLKTAHARVKELAASALQADDGKLPSEQRVLYVLEQLGEVAYSLIEENKPAVDTPTTDGAKQEGKLKDTTATSALLGSVNTHRYPNDLTPDSIINLISSTAESILRHPTVFITPMILQTYIQLQTFLSRPSSFPEIFDLYAKKPIPHAKKAPTPANPNAAKSAVPSTTVAPALLSSIAQKNLPLSISIINTTLATPAFKRAKIVRHIFPATVLLGGAPAVAFALAQQFSHVQTTMSPGYATGIAFAGFMTYLGTVTGLGYVVITTANDQMDRVTWAKGVPLWERWVREEERAAWDRVAGEWGFKDRGRRGEEEGEEWEQLREEIGMRGMVLDRVELMEGME